MCGQQRTGGVSPGDSYPGDKCAANMGIMKTGRELMKTQDIISAPRPAGESDHEASGDQATRKQLLCIVRYKKE